MSAEPLTDAEVADITAWTKPEIAAGWGNHTVQRLLATIADRDETIARLRDGLRPFVDYLDTGWTKSDDELVLLQHHSAPARSVTLGDLRRAAAALGDMPPDIAKSEPL